YMFDEYAKGRTPNPDVLCNREIKFNVFLKIALSLGADFVATGHYCQKSHFTDSQGKEIHQLLSGKDKNKDQSYFLCQLDQQQLSKVLFPIGHLLKAEVRAIATAQNLVTADKKDSQGLCFIGKVSLPDFLQQQLKPKKGEIIEIPADLEKYNETHKKTLEEQSLKNYYLPEEGVLVGEHEGAHFFTIGQRKGLRVGGMVEPLFVIDTDVENNTIYVGQGKQHPGLFREALKVDSSEIHWLRRDLSISEGETLEVRARIRYRQPLQKARLYQTKEGLYVLFDTPQSSITSGQFVAWYQGNELLGSGVIA
ncbi:MAG: tRNA 2-thiouridine(34) synthase MnmA, partial [Flavobacteriaceae bacterium]